MGPSRPDHGDFRSTPVNGHSHDGRSYLKGANTRSIEPIPAGSTGARETAPICSYREFGKSLILRRARIELIALPEAGDEILQLRGTCYEVTNQPN